MRIQAKAVALFTLACACAAGAFAQESLERLEELIDSPEEAVVRGYLGVVVDDRVRTGDGVTILVVRSETPAAAAGLQAGDTIVAVDGTGTPDIDAFAAAAAHLEAGRTVPVEVLRGRTRYELKITPAADATVARKPSEATPVPQAPSPAPRDSIDADGPPRLGLVIGPLRTRNYPLLGVGMSWGVIVNDVIPGSPAEQQGVPRGAMIVALNRVRVDRVSDLMRMMDQVDPSQPVELTYRYGGREIRQLLALTTSQPEREIERELPPAPAPADRDAAPIPPPFPELPEPPAPAPKPELKPAEPTPAKPKPPEAEVRLPTRAEKPPADSPDATRIEAMQRELDELRRRAATIEEALKELRSE